MKYVYIFQNICLYIYIFTYIHFYLLIDPSNYVSKNYRRWMNIYMHTHIMFVTLDIIFVATFSWLQNWHVFLYDPLHVISWVFFFSFRVLSKETTLCSQNV